MATFEVGDKVWFTGQGMPRLTGNSRLVCVVVKVNDPHDKWMRSYNLREIATGEISANNFPDMMEAYDGN